MTFTFCLAHPVCGAAQSADHSAWDELLHRYVTAGRVDYRGLQRDRAALDAYVASLAHADVSQLPKEAQLAFWINAYNACVITGVLEHYPLRSVQDVKGFFDTLRYPIARASLTLNEIEARGRALGDWRLHFGVVCASLGCPILCSEAYTPERVNAQLSEQVIRYLIDDIHGLRIDYAAKALWVSKIFKWYVKDFVPGGQFTAASLWAVIGNFLPQDIPLLPAPERFTLKFLDYDWSLNERRDTP